MSQKWLTVSTVRVCVAVFVFVSFLLVRLHICQRNRYCHCDATFVVMFTQSWCVLGIPSKKKRRRRRKDVRENEYGATFVQYDAVPYFIVSFPFNLFVCCAPVQDFNIFCQQSFVSSLQFIYSIAINHFGFFFFVLYKNTVCICIGSFTGMALKSMRIFLSFPFFFVLFRIKETRIC